MEKSNHIKQSFFGSKEQIAVVSEMERFLKSCEIKNVLEFRLLYGLEPFCYSLSFYFEVEYKIFNSAQDNPEFKSMSKIYCGFDAQEIMQRFDDNIVPFITQKLNVQPR